MNPLTRHWYVVEFDDGSEYVHYFDDHELKGYLNANIDYGHAPVTYRHADIRDDVLILQELNWYRDLKREGRELRPHEEAALAASSLVVSGASGKSGGTS